MKLIMMGTGEFAVPAFRRLLDQRYEVVLLVTQPDRPQGRHQKLVPAAIKQLALEHHVAVFQPNSVNTPESVERLAELGPDLLVVAAYGQILTDQLLQVSRLGGVNLHASLLPKYRGAAPVNWAIYHGETVTGVTVIRMTPRVDAGAILLQAETPIGPEETAGELETRLAELGAPLVSLAIDGLDAGTIRGCKQDRSEATRAPKLKKEDGLIDWTRTAAQVCNQIRAMQPWPMAYSFLHRTGKPPARIIIERAHSHLSVGGKVPPRPGEISVASQTDGIIVGAGGLSCVVIDQLRPSGKRTMSVVEFLRGNPVQPGDRFGPQT